MVQNMENIIYFFKELPTFKSLQYHKIQEVFLVWNITLF